MDRRGISLLYRVLCFTVRLMETEYQLGKAPRQPCCKCSQVDEVVVEVIHTKRA